MTAVEFANFFYNPRKKRQLSEVDDELDDLSKYFLQLSGLEYNEEGEAQLISSVLDVQKLLRAGNTITDVGISDTTGQAVITIAGQRIPIPPEEYESVIQAQQEQDGLLQQALAPTNQITTRGVLPSMEPIDLTSGNPKSSIIRNMKVSDLEALYNHYDLEGEDRNLEQLQTKIEEQSKILDSENLRPGLISRTIGNIGGTQPPYEIIPQPGHILGDVIKKTKHQSILDEAKKLAEETKKKETVAKVLTKTLPTPIELMTVDPNQNADFSTDEMKEQVFDSNSQGEQSLHMDGKTSPEFIIDNGIVENLSLENQPTEDSKIDAEKIIVDGEYKYILNREEGRLSIQKHQRDGSYKEVMNQDDWAKLPPNQQGQVMQNVAKAEQKQDESSIVIESGFPSIGLEAIGMTGRYDDYTGDTLESIPKRQESLLDGDYIYYYEDGLPIRIEDSQGNPYDINEKAKQVMLEKYDAKRKEEKVLREEGQSAIDQIVEESTPTQTNLEEVSETIAKEEPKTLKQLGQKAKQNFQGLGDEQKAMMGLMGLEVLSEGVNYLGPARKEARDRIEILEGRRERGQLGVDERQDADTMKYMTRPVRALAEETEREQQAVMAGMGETRSAADLRRLRDSRDAQMTDALSRAGQEVTRQQMARKEMEKRELNQLQAYQQENLRNLTNRITGAAANMAGTFGANVAAEADIQRELSPENIEKYIQILRQANPDATETELRRMATDFGIEKARAKLYTGL